MTITPEQIEEFRREEYIPGDKDTLNDWQMKYNDALHAICDLALAHVRGGWQPIDTAPKDGSTVLLLHHSGSVESRYWNNTMESWYPGGSNGFHSHWQPLPPPPEELT